MLHLWVLTMNTLTLYFLLAAATASISWTMTKTPMFDWVRDRLPDGMIYQLWVCPYCMSHWVAAFFVALYRPMPFTGVWVDLFTSMFAVIGLAVIFIQLINLASLLASKLKREDD